jgi:protein-S-isoprenylcysteine O-methyltransferase Ste14
MMTGYIAALTMVLLVGMVISRVILLRRNGIAAFQFGKTHKTDFLIPPFALFYFYLVFAHAFHWPLVSTQEFFHSDAIRWIGVALCLVGLLIFFSSLVSFGKSFRVGIDTEHPDKLITTGVFAYSRNPIYLAFGLVFVGQFLVFSNWILLVYLIAGAWLVHRQVLREEAYLKQHYGGEYLAYCQRVRRYI